MVDGLEIVKAIGRFFGAYLMAWVNLLLTFVQAVINEFGLWSATPLVAVFVLFLISFVPSIGWIPKWLFGFVVGNAWFYFKRLLSLSFGVWTFLLFLAYPPLGEFARFQSTIAMDAQQALLLLAGLVAQGGVCFYYARKQWRYATEMDTTVSQLKFQSRTSGVVAVAMTYISGWLIARHFMPWGLYVPWLMTLYSAWEIWDRTVNTAGLKPVTQMQQTN
ncbi:MAG: hypothetical protein AAB908_00885 [Patescibacteria group bacterium]